jgi:hypothetical protein
LRFLRKNGGKIIPFGEVCVAAPNSFARSQTIVILNRDPNASAIASFFVIAIRDHQTLTAAKQQFSDFVKSPPIS